MINDDEKAVEAVQKMFADDYFSQWLKITVLDIKAGYSKIQMIIRKEMLNGFGIAHGGIAFSFADSAFAFACNSDGRATLALDVSISFTKAAKENDILTAEARQVNKTNRTGVYLVEIKNQNSELVALFKGTCYTPGK